MPKAKTPARQLISLADAAAYLGVSTRTLRRRIADGTLTAFKVGPTELVRLDRAEVEALVTPVVRGGAEG